ncbi:GNAT family N-acetyltransferase [Streptomyces sp. NBC_00344]|uniref:GNAT family N-acetyltransferase n=1 Tax=Streptomyces sp. NBC_00344 TaxID=2975720 RepID=UPI003FA689A3
MITGRLIRLRPAVRADLRRFREILAAPEVARWWGDPDEQAEEACAPPDDIRSYAIEYAGVCVGIIQSCEENTPGYRHAGIDIAVHPGRQRQGIGADAVHTLARHLLDVRGHHRLTIDPATDNEAAISLYRSLGFRPVGVMRQYERRRDGSFHDGLLMDLLRDELRSPEPR